MAIVTLNEEYLRNIHKFEFHCLKCKGKNVAIEIDWGAYPSMSWNITTLICKDCHEEEIIRESG